MMRRWATGIGVAVVAGIVFTAGTAQASPTNNASSIALTCDKGVDSTATLTLQESSTNPASLGIVTIQCGADTPWGLRNRTSIPTGTVPAGYVTVSLWTTTSGASCSEAASLAFKGSCAAAGSSGAQLTVR